jgi:hypothetical protein
MKRCIERESLFQNEKEDNTSILYVPLSPIILLTKRATFSPVDSTSAKTKCRKTEKRRKLLNAFMHELCSAYVLN